MRRPTLPGKGMLHSDLLFLKILFYVYECSAGVCVWTPLVCRVPTEAGRRHWIQWRERTVRDIMWVPGNWPGLLREQHDLLAAEPSLQIHTHTILTIKIDFLKKKIRAETNGKETI